MDIGAGQAVAHRIFQDLQNRRVDLGGTATSGLETAGAWRIPAVYTAVMPEGGVRCHWKFGPPKYCQIRPSLFADYRAADRSAYSDTKAMEDEAAADCSRPLQGFGAPEQASSGARRAISTVRGLVPERIEAHTGRRGHRGPAVAGALERRARFGSRPMAGWDRLAGRGQRPVVPAASGRCNRMEAAGGLGPGRRGAGAGAVHRSGLRSSIRE